MMGHNYFSLETTKYRQLKDRLLADYPSLDDETLADTLEGITDLNEMIAAVIRSALVDEALQSGLRQRLDEMKVRMVRLEQRSKRKRELCLEAMTEVGIKARAAGLHRFSASGTSGPCDHGRSHNS